MMRHDGLLLDNENVNHCCGGLPLAVNVNARGSLWWLAVARKDEMVSLLSCKEHCQMMPNHGKHQRVMQKLVVGKK
jgi:hypothetical protein